MKRKSLLIVVIGMAVLVSSIWFHNYGTGPRPFGVTMSPRGSRTNVNGQVVLLFAISNAGRRMVLITPGVQTPTGFDLRYSSESELQPGEERIVELGPNAPPGRALVHCQRQNRGRLAEVERFLYRHLLGRHNYAFVFAQPAL